MRNFERRKRIFFFFSIIKLCKKVLNPQGNYKGYQTKMLLEISISQSDCGDMTLFQTIQEVIGRINIGKWIDFHRQRRDAYDPTALLTILLFAYARYGYASLRQLEEMSRYDLRAADGFFRDRHLPIKPISALSMIS